MTDSSQARIRRIVALVLSPFAFAADWIATTIVMFVQLITEQPPGTVIETSREFWDRWREFYGR